MKKINIAELLKDCPKGMELDCTMYENVEFDYIEQNHESAYPIRCLMKINGGYNSLVFTHNGCNDRHPNAKCVIFPKGKTTWEGFTPPCKFKDEDVVVAEDSKSFQLFLLKHLTHSENDNSHNGYCYFGWDFELNSLFEKGNCVFNRLATEEEKEKLFQAIKDNGYRWNDETKTLEKLIEPKFKVGDRIKHIYFDRKVAKVVKIHDKRYELDNGKFIEFQDENAYEISYNKFDITTLKPFDKVLYRRQDKDTWFNGFYSFYRNNCHFVNSTVLTKQCIPYEGNEHLLDKTNDCNEYYKTWE